VALYAFGEKEPDIHPEAFVHPEAVIIGSVTIGAESSIWPTAVLRGDDGQITVGARTSIQDGAIIHTTVPRPTIIGNDCTIGHLAHLEGCTIEDGSLVGSAAVVLHRAVVGPRALVAANAVVLNDMVVPTGALALGVPAKIREGAADQEELVRSAASYVDRARRFRTDLRRID
jgi:carbonic anhydrase/acetyltransferase-like protein (isoleucine patch superfamily)